MRPYVPKMCKFTDISDFYQEQFCPSTGYEHFGNGRVFACNYRGHLRKTDTRTVNSRVGDKVLDVHASLKDGDVEGSPSL